MERIAATPHDATMPTALAAARYRQPSSLSLCQEIFDAAQKLWPRAHLKPPPELPAGTELPACTETLEARHVAITALVGRALADRGSAQVLELGAGFTPRGLDMSQDPTVKNYVEFDLPPISRLKRIVAGQIAQRGLSPNPAPNLQFAEGNALDAEHVITATEARLFTGQPLVVVAEGFLHYLCFNQRTKLLRILNGQLRRFPGSVLIADVPLVRPKPSPDDLLAAQVTPHAAAHRYQPTEFIDMFRRWGFALVQFQNPQATYADLSSPRQPQALQQGIETIRADSFTFMWEHMG